MKEGRARGRAERRKGKIGSNKNGAFKGEEKEKKKGVEQDKRGSRG